MAPAAKSRPGRYLAVVALALVALYLGLFLGPSQTPKLGLDLRGGTEVTLTAHPINGDAVSKADLNQAVNIIRQRANGLGVAGAEVSTQGGTNIVVDIPGQGSQVVNTIGQTALLRFRQVMQFAAPVPATATTARPNPTASSSTKATPKKSPTAKSTKKKKSASQGRALSSALVKAKSSPSPTPTPTTATTATPSPTTSAVPGTAATTTTSNTDQALPGSQSPTLTSAFQKSFANWDCTKKTTANPTQGADNPNDYIIACGNNGQGLEKFLLAPAKVEGTQVKSASAALDTQGGGDWLVNLNFNGSGASAWQKLTATAYNADPTDANASTCAPPTGCNSVAIVLDGNVSSAPTITQAGGIPGGAAQITGNFSQSTATQLADILKYGSLPLRFTAPSIQSISPTLGSQQLRGGLIAGAIGLALVILFSLLYYRALGLVTIGSLAVSGLILYAVTTLLGHSAVGYTLSLPGIAGFIVAVGITADSFVVFFERLRDEVREGIRLRSAVERAWPRARRTIISADSVSLLAAVILYIVSIGDVRGFAFTLGLSTISDLFIVFFFTKPLLTVLARQPAFDKGKSWTGIGRPREGAQLRDDDNPPTRRRPRTREA